MKFPMSLKVREDPGQVYTSLMLVSTLTRVLPPPQPEVLHDYWKISSLILKA